MASMHRKGATWFAWFRHNGKLTSRSLHTADREKAKQALAELERALALGKRQAFDAEQFAAMVARLTDLDAGKKEKAGIGAWLSSWLSRKRHELAPGSLPEYESAVRHLTAFLGAAADRPLGSLDTETIARFRAHLLESKAPGTVRKTLKILGGSFSSAQREGLTRDNPFSRLGALRIEKQEGRRPFTLEEIRRLLEEAQSSEWQGLILFGFYTGQRLGDLAKLTWANLDLGKGEIRFTAQKTGRRMILPLAEPLRDYLLSLPGSDKPSAAIFPRSAEIARKGVSTLSRQFGELLARCGMRNAATHETKGIGRGGKRETSELSFHSLRHTATTALKAAGVSHAVAQALIGHESAAVSTHYTHIDTATLRAGLDKLPALGGNVVPFREEQAS